jgi:hypothetical protein
MSHAGSNGGSVAGGAGGVDLTSPKQQEAPSSPSTKMTVASEEFADLPPVAGIKICCLGAGYVGGPTMAMIAKRTLQVTRPRGGGLPFWR